MIECRISNPSLDGAAYTLRFFLIIRRENGYLARYHMHFVNGQTIRQDPGPDNWLRPSVLFENPYNVPSASTIKICLRAT